MSTPARDLPPYEAVQLRTHRRAGWPDQLEVVEAPTQTAITVEVLQQLPPDTIRRGERLVLGTPGLGRGQVEYLIYAWDTDARALRAVLLPTISAEPTAEAGR